MKHGIYIGSDPTLNGKTAYIQELDNNTVKVQFDDLTLDEGKTELKNCLAYGWTVFPKSDFKY